MTNISQKILQRSAIAKTALRELFYRPAWYSDKHHEMERLFRWSHDPWNFKTSPYEQDRFGWLLETIRDYPHNSILEVGCAEGLFTSHLQTIAKTVVAIDVSATAISRAQQYCRQVTFVHQNLHDFTSEEEFDLVVCCETIYYMKDVQSAIEKLSGLARYCLVSYLTRESKRLDPYFHALPTIDFRTYKKPYLFWNRSMNIAVWKGDGVLDKR